MSVTSVHLLDGGPCATAWGAVAAEAATGHAALWHTAAASGLVHLHHDGIDDALQLFLLSLELVLLGLLDLLPIPVLELVLELLLLQRVAHGEAVVLEAVLSLDLRLVRLVLGGSPGRPSRSS